MKKIFFVLLSMLLIISLCSCIWEKDVISNENSSSLPKQNSLRITALGDSIAAGYGLEDQKDNYLSIFADNIGASLKNDAVSGYDSDDLIEFLSVSQTATDIRNADLIIVSVGGNDILHNKDEIISTIKDAYLHGGNYFPESINRIYDNFETNLTEIFLKLKSLNPRAAIIIQTLYNPALKQGYKVSLIDASKLVDKYIVRLNESIISVSSSFDNIFVFDIADEMNKDADNFYNLQTDFDIHPTKKGHLTLSVLFTKYYNEN